ncbi:MAG: hypothetical protein A2486_12725 [Burkholderiales bacterium RIFOXYC12_FULL_65_23]|uniref:hypothetical protein n=1 Tax=Malikia spinosa TaxID=86180 RepID=UPI0008B24C52|nr:MAG: hypothetical protein A2486_12725 [Burkholderiales bacterium RIFOXYC12_FULL_65_23]
MFNPRSLVWALYTHWDAVEGFVRLSREFAVFTSEQALNCIAKVSPELDAEAQGGVLRTLVNAAVLQSLPRSSDLQINAYVLEFVRGLTREHELGLTAVLQARVAAIREATEGLNEGMKGADRDRVSRAARQLAELFRQISLQLDQDRHAILDLAETAKSSDSSMPVAQRYRRVLEAFDKYVEPMNQMMDTGPEGTFYRYLEEAERSLDWAVEQLAVQGALYTHRLQLRQVAHQAKELRRFGRLVAQQCADTLLPLREELRQHNALSSAVSALLGQVRKRGLKRTLARKTPDTSLPLWRNERGFRLQLGDEVRGIMAAARNYVPQTVAFPQGLPVEPRDQLELVDEAGIRAHLRQSLPVESLLDWLQTHYCQLADTTLLGLFHDLQHEAGWECEAAPEVKATELHTVRVLHHPHRMSTAT